MTHDHFLQCSLSIARKEEILKAIEKKPEALKTQSHIASRILTKTKKYYNNNELQQQQHLPTSINNQTAICWERFCRGLISKLLTHKISLHYTSDNKPYSFTGMGWSRTLIEFLITLHLEEWYNRCTSNVDQKTIHFKDNVISMEKRVLLFTVEHLYEKATSLPEKRENGSALR